MEIFYPNLVTFKSNFDRLAAHDFRTETERHRVRQHLPRRAAEVRLQDGLRKQPGHQVQRSVQAKA